MWPGYVAEHLLPRIYGFELLMVPYAVAHMKLGLQLKESGYDFASDERLRVYLTNTLEEAHELTGLPLFASAIAHEAASASAVKKDAPIMVVIGNPPYSGHSANKGEWIANLLRGIDGEGRKTANYFEVDGRPLGERNPKMINDDYVKFIRFSQHRIERTGYGIMGFITNHGYLDNPTFRGMRDALLGTFDDLYILDLHGNSKKNEVAPDGSKDENVFDIQQGVSIGIFVKRAAKVNKTIRYASLWGRRESKYQWLNQHDVENTKWDRIKPSSPAYEFTKVNGADADEYPALPSLQDIFASSSSCMNTARDAFVVSIGKGELVRRFDAISKMKPGGVSALSEQFELSNTEWWSFESAVARFQKRHKWKDQILPSLQRPFDFRWLAYFEEFLDRPRAELNRNMLKWNLQLAFTRQTKEAFSVLVSAHMFSQHKIVTVYDRSYFCSALHLFGRTRGSFGERQ